MSMLVCCRFIVLSFVYRSCSLHLLFVAFFEQRLGEASKDIGDRQFETLRIEIMRTDRPVGLLASIGYRIKVSACAACACAADLI